MSTGESPPERPPMLSPDGKWVWNGSAWLPIAGHESVFPAWNAIQVPVETAPQVAQPAAVQVETPAPVYQYPMVEPEAEAVVPLWQQQAPTGYSKYLYIVAGMVAIVVIGIAVNSFGPLSFPWSPSDSGPRAAASPPAPVASRSAFGRADNFLTAYLAPALADIDQNTKSVRGTCSGTLSSGCNDAITATDKSVKKALKVVDRAAPPSCIATTVAKLKVDLASMEDASQIALKSYTDNSLAELDKGLSGIGSSAQRAQADAATANTQKKLCDTQLVGP